MPSIIGIAIVSGIVVFVKPLFKDFATELSSDRVALMNGRSLLKQENGIEDSYFEVFSTIVWSGKNDAGQDAFITKFAYKEQEDYADIFTKCEYSAFYIDNDMIYGQVMPCMLELDQQMVFVLGPSIGVSESITPAHGFYKIQTSVSDF